MEMQQITVKLPPDLVAFVERVAARETRSVASLIRHYVAEAARRAGNPTAGVTAWPPELMTVTSSNIDEARALVAELTAEYERLRALERRSPMGLMPHDDERLRFCRDRIDALGRQIRPIERMLGARS